MVDLALKNLLHDKLRFFITVLGVAFAVTLVLVQAGLFVGLLDNATLGIDHMPAELWVTSKNTPNIDFAKTFPETHVQRVRSVPGVERADNLIIWFMNVALPSGAQEGVQIYALEDFKAWNFPWNVTEGNIDDLRRGQFIFLDEYAKKRFGPFHTGEYREVLGRRMKIIGRTKDARSFTTAPIAFMDYRNAQSITPDILHGNTTYIIVKLKPGADVETVRREIQKRLPYNDVFTAAEWARQTRNYWITNTGIGLNAYLTVFLGCLVGIVVVAQTLYTSTMEHIKEFGTVKAIGGSNSDIYLILGRQAVIAAVVGFAMGLVPAYALGPAVRSLDLKLIIPTPFVGIVFVGTVIMCLAASAISFRKVASIDPGLVFRT